jgi:tetratricopeptide (TPR) repeat protein
MVFQLCVNLTGLSRKWTRRGKVVCTALALFLSFATKAQPVAPQFTNPPIVLTVEGTNVFIQRFGSNQWETAYANQVLAAKDRGRTGNRSRTSVRLSDLSVMRISERSEFEIQPLLDQKAEAEFSLLRGLLYLLNRDRPGKHRFVTPTATAATRGTEFTLEVEEATGRTILTVLEGEAELSNPAGSVIITSGEQGVAILGQQPTKTAVIDTTNVVQWCLYYPGILDLGDLSFEPAEQAAISDSLTEYARGELLRALSAYPVNRNPDSDAEKIYLGALLLSVGQVPQAESLLATLSNAAGPASRHRRLTDALRSVIAVVKQYDNPTALSPKFPFPLPTELLAASYFQQSQHKLNEALESARQAVKQSPRFAFAWTRIAELEFSRGNTRRAAEALEQSLSLAPRNAQAIALKGFLLAARNRISEATGYFEQAMAIDGGLGNAWLGRGLCRIRQGRAAEGRLDLQVAATTEPRRSLLRSYLGKGFSNDGDPKHAEKELRLASEIDAGDPTPWLYSALLLQQQNRINEGVQDLQRSQELNDNRQLYRSRLLLDQDRAVRGANLANLYRDAGMVDVSVREAARAVNSDYANYSAHLFLANSFNELRDPKQFDLRYETAWFTEYLVANLLAPVGAGALSQSVSQQEYSRLFERDRLGVVSHSAYASHGEFIQRLVQFGTLGNSSYSAEVSYHWDDGWRPNNDLTEWTAVVDLKHQLTDQDGLYLQVTYDQAKFGDVGQRYSQSDFNRDLRIRERREPFIIAGYHREWSPYSHTLFLVGRLQDTLEKENPSEFAPFFFHASGAPIASFAPLYLDQQYRLEQEVYSAELQQILRYDDHTFVFGGRYQFSNMDVDNDEPSGVLSSGAPVMPGIVQSIASEMERRSIYAYDYWQVWPTLTLAGGVSYDWLRFPRNYSYGPVSDDETSREQISPKAGFVFTPFTNTTLRGAWFRGLGGVSFEQSLRLEPSQVAGFNQAYRSIVPESVGGLSLAHEFEGWGLSLEQKIGKGTFLGLSGEILSSKVNRRVGAVDFQVPGGISLVQTREILDYRERTLTATFNQLLSDEWSLGARYRISRADLEDVYQDIPVTAVPFGFQRALDVESVLNQVQLWGLYHHPSGFFGIASAVWNLQSNQGYTPDQPGDEFWQFNIEAGWRFLRRRLEARVGLLNLTDQNYRLNPLNLTSELPREREVVVSLQLNF